MNEQIVHIATDWTHIDFLDWQKQQADRQDMHKGILYLWKSIKNDQKIETCTLHSTQNFQNNSACHIWWMWYQIADTDTDRRQHKKITLPPTDGRMQLSAEWERDRETARMRL
jgi:hypothetical protein